MVFSGFVDVPRNLHKYERITVNIDGIGIVGHSVMRFLIHENDDN